jgi:glycosyltransferase involved in cell wall biosynthesis
MKKRKILFDATIISSGWAKNSNRSGIFFASLNILKELLKRQELDISLYCAPAAIRGLQIVLRNSFAKYPDFKIINEDESSFLEKIQNKLISEKLSVNTRPLKLKCLRYLSLFVKALAILQNRFYCSKALKMQINDFDIYFSPGYLAPKIIRDNQKIKRYILLYDIIPLLFPNLFPFMKYFGYSWTKTVVDHLESDDYCFSISEQTKQDFLDVCPKLIPERIVVTPLAASENFYHCTDADRIETVKKKYNIPLNKKYIFSLCTLEPRKNLLMSVKCFIEFIKKNEIDDLIFVLGGGNHEAFVGTIEKELNGVKECEEKIVRIGYIDDEDLAPLYSKSEFFLYPSIYEGFGLPPLEAMQCGCPVISSKTSSLPEVVDNAGILIDPQSETELIEAMKKLYYDDVLRLQLSSKGLQRALHFSWKKCTDIMVREMLR